MLIRHGVWSIHVRTRNGFVIDGKTGTSYTNSVWKYKVRIKFSPYKSKRFRDFHLRAIYLASIGDNSLTWLNCFGGTYKNKHTKTYLSSLSIDTLFHFILNILGKNLLKSLVTVRQRHYFSLLFGLTNRIRVPCTLYVAVSFLLHLQYKVGISVP